MYRIIVYLIFLSWSIDFIKIKGLETNGQTSYYSSALGELRSCADICEPDRSTPSCTYYCAEYSKSQASGIPVKQDNNSGGSLRFGLLSIPVVLLLATVALYLVRKQRITHNERVQLTADIEHQIDVSPNDGSCGVGIQECSVNNPPEHQHLLNQRSDLTTVNAPATVMSASEPETLFQHGPSALHIGATVPLTENELGPPISSAQTSIHSIVT